MFKKFQEYLPLYDIRLVISFFQIGCRNGEIGFMMDELMFSLCCVSNRGLLCGSLSKELHLDGAG